MTSSKSNISSPSFPSVQQVSGDIFFQVKKQILDKLDIILQKVNLQVIEYLKPQGQRKQQKKVFKFIELSSFEKQIQTLFDYLDRLYESLNSSVSFSTNDIKNTMGNHQSVVESNKNNVKSIGEYNSLLINELGQLKLKYQQLQEQSHRLRQQNEHMRFLLKTNFSQTPSLAQSFNQQSKGSLKMNKNQLKNKQSVKSINEQQPFQSKQVQKNSAPLQMQGISLETVKKILRFYNHSIRQLSVQYKETVKQIKKTLKQVKFQIIQNRVQCIAELKKWSQKVQNKLSQKQIKVLQQKQLKQNILTVNKGTSFDTSNQNQSIDQICGQSCIKKQYIRQCDKNGFQQELLQKIQQILDVC